MSMTCKLSAVSEVSLLLSSLQLVREKDQQVWISALPSGLKLCIESPSRDLTGSGFLPKDIFSEYNVTGTAVEKMTSLMVLLQCLSIFTNSAVLALEFSEESADLSITLQETDRVTACQIRCQDLVDYVSFDFEPQDHLILMPERLKDCLVVDVYPSDHQPFVFAMELHTAPCKSRVELTFNGSNFLMNSYQVSVHHRHTYRLASLQTLQKSLGISHSVKLRWSSEGVMSVQCMRKLDNIRKTWCNECDNWLPPCIPRIFVKCTRTR
eukprot:Platyproteum_vivax@DN7196_c0_g1_i4.p1